MPCYVVPEGKCATESNVVRTRTGVPVMMPHAEGNSKMTCNTAMAI